MLDGLTTIAATLAVFGVQTTVDGQPLTVAPCIDSDAELDGGMIDHDGPYAIASAADIAALSVTTGNTGSEIIIDGNSYTVLAIKPDGLGMAWIVLSEAY